MECEGTMEVTYNRIWQRIGQKEYILEENRTGIGSNLPKMWSESERNYERNWDCNKKEYGKN